MLTARQGHCTLNRREMSGHTSLRRTENTLKMLSQSDEDLIEALRNGDENALRTLVDLHTPSIYRFSVRYTGDESLAQDICQEVFLKVYRYARRYKPGMPFKTWLFTIVRNTSIDLARAYSYRKIHSLDTVDEAEIIELGNRSHSRKTQTPEEDYSSKETAQMLESALGALPEKQRTAMLLKYYEEMSIKEIAEIMETTVSSVESLLVRAKRNLLKWLEL
jgi:RNA polymerase sigma-70 factor (ECF subfamily)